MTVEEAKKATEELKAQGNSEEEILAIYYEMFKDDKLDEEALEKLVNILGWELTPEWKAMGIEDKKTKGYETTDETEATKEEVEEAKELETDSDSKPNPNPTPNPDKKEEKDDEEEKARHLFGFDK